MKASSLLAVSWKESLSPRLKARPSTRYASCPPSVLMRKSSPQQRTFCFIRNFIGARGELKRIRGKGKRINAHWEFRCGRQQRTFDNHSDWDMMKAQWQ